MRWIALAIALFTIALVAIFVGAVLRPPANVASSNGGQAEGLAMRTGPLTGQAGDWAVSAEITQSATGAVGIVLSLTDRAGRPADSAARPQALLRMANMVMGAQTISLERDASGLWRGSGTKLMDGRWSLQVDIDGARVALPFDSKPR